jgi:hypothetical protein
MILDNIQQKELLINIINSSNYPGGVIEQIYELKQAIIHAEVKSAENKRNN